MFISIKQDLPFELFTYITKSKALFRQKTIDLVWQRAFIFTLLIDIRKTTLLIYRTLKINLTSKLASYIKLKVTHQSSRQFVKGTETYPDFVLHPN